MTDLEYAQHVLSEITDEKKHLEYAKLFKESCSLRKVNSCNDVFLFFNNSSDQERLKWIENKMQELYNEDKELKNKRLAHECSLFEDWEEICLS